LKYRENLCTLFKESIDNIYEDTSCYGKKLNLKILDCILKRNGIYHMERYIPTIVEFIEELYLFEDYYQKFTVDLDKNKIIKNNGNTIIANEKENNHIYNEAIKIIENRKKLDESDKEKRKEYRIRNPYTRDSRRSKTVSPQQSISKTRKSKTLSPNQSKSRKRYRTPSPKQSKSRKRVKYN
jgi:hypothetical protein